MQSYRLALGPVGEAIFSGILLPPGPWHTEIGYARSETLSLATQASKAVR